MFQRYEKRHEGTALVLGSAPTLPEDFHAIITVRPDAAIFAVNEATHVVEPDFICSFHYEKLDQFDAYARRKWPKGRWTRHAAVVTERGCTPDSYPMVDYWWPELWKPARTSAWFGARIAELMGFSEIIFCGCPMNGGDGYYNGTALSNERFGAMAPGKAYIKSVRESIAHVAQGNEMPGLRSMSGYTRELFGCPEGI